VLKENLIPSFGELRTCLHLAEKVLLQVKIREDILDDPNYKYISSVDKVNRMVAKGVPFRDAYQTIAQQIRNKTFSNEDEFDHTHEGSLGNLCLTEIEKKMEQRIRSFDFEKVDKAFRALLKK
jgi:argininosuccinate lyase